MTRSEDTSNSRPISVAELLARSGTISAPPSGGRRRRRRGNVDAVTVAELTGEIPVVTDTPPEPEQDASTPVDTELTETTESVAEGTVAEQSAEPDVEPDVAEQEAEPDVAEQDAEPDEADQPAEPEVDEAPAEPVESVEPRPRRLRYAHAFRRRSTAVDSGAEQMSPDPLDDNLDDDLDDGDDRYDSPIDLADPPETDYSTDVADADEFSDREVGSRRSWLRSTDHDLFGGPTVVDIDEDDIDFDLEDEDADEAEADEDVEPVAWRSRLATIARGGGVVLQCLLAVAFGAGLFLAFDQLWRWNGIVTLVLAGLVTLGLAAAVRVVRKNEDFTSTMIAIAVGILVTFGPLTLQLPHLQAN